MYARPNLCMLFQENPVRRAALSDVSRILETDTVFVEDDNPDEQLNERLSGRHRPCDTTS